MDKYKNLKTFSSLGFMVLSLGVLTYFTASPQIKQFVASYAKGRKSAEDRGSPQARQQQRISEGSSTTGKKGDVPVVNPVQVSGDLVAPGSQNQTGGAAAAGAGGNSITIPGQNQVAPTTGGIHAIGGGSIGSAQTNNTSGVSATGGVSVGKTISTNNQVVSGTINVQKGVGTTTGNTTPVVSDVVPPTTVTGTANSFAGQTTSNALPSVSSNIKNVQTDLQKNSVGGFIQKAIDTIFPPSTNTTNITQPGTTKTTGGRVGVNGTDNAPINLAGPDIITKATVVGVPKPPSNNIFTTIAGGVQTAISNLTNSNSKPSAGTQISTTGSSTTDVSKTHEITGAPPNLTGSTSNAQTPTTNKPVGGFIQKAIDSIFPPNISSTANSNTGGSAPLPPTQNGDMVIVTSKPPTSADKISQGWTFYADSSKQLLATTYKTSKVITPSDAANDYRLDNMMGTVTYSELTTYNNANQEIGVTKVYVAPPSTQNNFGPNNYNSILVIKQNMQPGSTPNNEIISSETSTKYRTDAQGKIINGESIVYNYDSTHPNGTKDDSASRFETQKIQAIIFIDNLLGIKYTVPSQ